MEFPDLGNQCNEVSCRQLDFLPLKCDGCKNTFCSDHHKYESHACLLANQKNHPAPVPERKKDAVVSKKKKGYSTKCCAKGCKVKELIPLFCDNCELHVCLRHRFPTDHGCTAPVKVPEKPILSWKYRVRRQPRQRNGE